MSNLNRLTYYGFVKPEQHTRYGFRTFMPVSIAQTKPDTDENLILNLDSMLLPWCTGEGCLRPLRPCLPHPCHIPPCARPRIRPRSSPSSVTSRGQQCRGVLDSAHFHTASRGLSTCPSRCALVCVCVYACVCIARVIQNSKNDCNRAHTLFKIPVHALH